MKIIVVFVYELINLLLLFIFLILICFYYGNVFSRSRAYLINNSRWYVMFQHIHTLCDARFMIFLTIIFIIITINTIGINRMPMIELSSSPLQLFI